jgi:hypothetical protein
LANAKSDVPLQHAESYDGQHSNNGQPGAQHDPTGNAAQPRRPARRIAAGFNAASTFVFRAFHFGMIT